MEGELPVFLPPLLGGVLAFLSIWRTLRNGRLARLVRDLPTTPASGVFIGYNEVKGAAESDEPHHSYLAERPCVYSRYNIAERWSRMVTEHYRDSKGNMQTRTRRESGWRTVDSGEVLQPFFIRDASGALRILPEGAEIEPLSLFSRQVRRSDPLYYGKGPAHSVMDSDHIRRFTEFGIPVSSPLYILGQARERQDIVAAEIAMSKETPFYLISTRSEEEVLASATRRVWGWSIFGAVAGVAGAVWIPVEQGGDPIFPGGLALAIFLVSLLLGQGMMVHNSLLRLRNRVRQAVSLIEIQAKRRADLIPALVQVVQAGKTHSEAVFRALADLRSASTASHLLAPQIAVIHEAYPELKDHALFLDLQRRLSDCEDRIALARNHHRALVSAYNTRLECIPDRWVAALSRHRVFPLTDPGMEISITPPNPPPSPLEPAAD